MFMKELLKRIGVEIEVHNLITDYTLSDGTRAHIAHQVIVQGTGCSEREIIEHVKKGLPSGSRICTVFEIMGDFELQELDRLATSIDLLTIEKRCIYGDKALVDEYIDEIMHGKF